MSGVQRIAEISPDLGDLRRQVRLVTREAHRKALVHTLAAKPYEQQLAAVFDAHMTTRDVFQRVICFASGTEFGLDLRAHAESARQAADLAGNEALRTLYQAAARRLRSRWGEAARRIDADRATLAAAARVWTKRESPAETPCEHCVRLRQDSRCERGHEGLQAKGDTQWHALNTGGKLKVRVHRCAICNTQWMRHQGGSDPFGRWTIRQAPKVRASTSGG